MLTAFNITLQGDFWRYRNFVVPLQRHSEEKLLMTTQRKSLRTLHSDYKRINNH